MPRAETCGRRPVMISSVTDMFGPALPAFNPGAKLYRGLGAGVLFGLLFSPLITLTVIPALPSLALQSRGRLGARRTATAS